MGKMMRISSVIATIVFIGGLAGLLLQSRSALAIPSLQTAFIAQYPFLRDTSLDSCTTCHMPAEKDFLNGYGIALRDARMNFEEIEDEDSDGDGTSNIDEINDESFPGSRATAPEYFVFHVKFSKTDPEVGAVHFNHEMHVVKESFLSNGRCSNCHGKNKFPRKFDDTKSIRPLAHTICWRCHETSGSKLAPRDCTGCHTGVENMLNELKQRLEVEPPKR